MSHLCTACSKLDFESLFFNNFCTAARCLELATDLDDDVHTITLLSSARQGIHPDYYNFDASEDVTFLGDLLREWKYDGDNDNQSIRDLIETRLLAPLRANNYAKLVADDAERQQPNFRCDLCQLLADQRLWRQPIGTSWSFLNPKADQVSLDTLSMRYLFPSWPQYKLIWYNYFVTPNELYLIEAGTNKSLPPDQLDDCLLDRTQDARTLCLYDDPRGVWKSIPNLVDWQRVKTWLPPFTSNSHALNELGECRSASFMLLDVQDNRIVRVGTLSGMKYAALSYVWGAARTSEAWCQNIQTKHDAGLVPVPIDFDSLPATLQDAMVICRSLDIKYLWIDSICIAQNQDLNKANAIADMGHIYMACHLCIVAAANGGVHDPLPGVRTPRNHHYLTINGLKIGISTPALRDTLHSSKWNSRGWCFQESTLAPRSLVIMEDQIFLQSGNSIRCESVDIDIGNDYDEANQDFKEEPLTTLSLYSNTDADTTFSIYKDFIVNYTRRNLSFEADIEHAFEGLAKVLHRRFGLRLFHGLSATHFVQSLNWFCPNAKRVVFCVDGPGKEQPPSRERVRSNGQPFGPSWSWTSRVGPIEYTTIPSEGLHIPNWLQTIVLDEKTDMPAGGFEKSFATKTNQHGQISLLAPLRIKSPVYHADKVQLPAHKVILSDWLDDLSQHRFVLDGADISSLTGDVYILPFTYRDAIAQTITAALLVELFVYPFAIPSTFKRPSVSQDQLPSPATTAYKGPLTSSDTLSTVYLAKRIGVIPFGITELEPLDHTDSGVLSLVLA